MGVASRSEDDEDACRERWFAPWLRLGPCVVWQNGNEAESGCDEEGSQGGKHEGERVERG